MKTKAEYLEDIRHCPQCHSTSINTRRPLERADADTIHHTVNCMERDCDAVWTDVFTVSGVDYLRHGGKWSG